MKKLLVALLVLVLVVVAVVVNERRFQRQVLYQTVVTQEFLWDVVSELDRGGFERTATALDIASLATTATDMVEKRASRRRLNDLQWIRSQACHLIMVVVVRGQVSREVFSGKDREVVIPELRFYQTVDESNLGWSTDRCRLEVGYEAPLPPFVFNR